MADAVQDGQLTVSDRLAEMDEKLDELGADMKSVLTKTGADYERHKRHESRLDKVESWQEWASRLVLGAVILGVIAVAFNV